MISIDTKGDKPEKHPGRDLVEKINNLGISCEASDLLFGDAAFEGNGPDGLIGVGIERKTLHDMLSCIDDARYTGHQRIGMKNMYKVSILLVEGHWKPHDPKGLMMEGFSGGISWGYCRQGSKMVMYSKLRRYLFSVALSGVIVCYTRDLFHTAYDIHEWYHYFQKPWDHHTSLMELQVLNIPTLRAKPTLVRKWANDIEDVGTKLSLDAEMLFKTPIKLATSEEQDWLKIRGIGVPTAQKIIRQIWGNK